MLESRTKQKIVVAAIFVLLSISSLIYWIINMPMGGRSALVMDSTKILLYFSKVKSELVDYANANGGEYPETYKLNNTLYPEINDHYKYLGKGVNYKQTSRCLVVIVVSRRFDTSGYPVIWSDGTVETINKNDIPDVQRRTLEWE